MHGFSISFSNGVLPCLVCGSCVLIPLPPFEMEAEVINQTLLLDDLADNDFIALQDA